LEEGWIIRTTGVNLFFLPPSSRKGEKQRKKKKVGTEKEYFSVFDTKSGVRGMARETERLCRRRLLFEEKRKDTDRER